MKMTKFEMSNQAEFTLRKKDTDEVLSQGIAQLAASNVMTGGVGNKHSIPMEAYKPIEIKPEHEFYESLNKHVGETVTVEEENQGVVVYSTKYNVSKAEDVIILTEVA